MTKLARLLLLCLGLALAPAPAISQRRRVPQSPAGISRLVENRGGRVSCRGVVIRLGNTRFRGVVRPEQIVIREGKHGRDLRGLMEWRVGQGGRRLVIRFKPGSGDFGSGNRVEVEVDRSAFAGGIAPPNERFAWSISTDLP